MAARHGLAWWARVLALWLLWHLALLPVRAIIRAIWPPLRRAARWLWARRPRRERWDDETLARIRAQFAGGAVCEFCGGLHHGKCPRLRRVVLSDSGNVREAEFWPWREWPRHKIIWPEDLPSE